MYDLLYIGIPVALVLGYLYRDRLRALFTRADGARYNTSQEG